MFNIPIFHFKVENWDEKKSALIELYNLVENDCEMVEGTDVITNYHQNCINIRQDISYIFYSEIKRFTDIIEYNECIVDAAWFEKSYKNHYHKIHNHGALGYSSVCFINYDENEHTPTQFIAPYNNFINGVSLIYNPQNVIESSIIFFPSAINHFTEPNKSDKERLVVWFRKWWNDKHMLFNV